MYRTSRVSTIVGIAVTSLALLGPALVAGPAAASAAPSPVRAGAPRLVLPAHGSTTAGPDTAITVRGVAAGAATVTATGSVTGSHPGAVRSHRAGTGFTFDPVEPFRAGERVTVTVDTASGRTSSAFVVATPGPDSARAVAGEDVASADGLGTQATSGPPYVTRPDIRAPSVEVSVPAASPRGDVLLATPRASGATDAGLMAFDEQGELVWWRAADPARVTGDLDVGRYFGQDVLVWFEGTAPFGAGHYRGEWVVVDSSYRELTRIQAGNGLEADLHDIAFTDRGTAYVVIYSPLIRDLTSIGGRANAVVLEAVIQEIDLLTRDVVWEWHSLDEIPVERMVDPHDGAIVDYIHINSVEEMADGDVLASMRNTSEVVKIDKGTATVEWLLGGEASDFTFTDEGNALQHDAREVGPNRISIFDNGNGKSPERSRGVVYELDLSSMVATQVAEYRDAPDTFAGSQGATQVLDDGVFVAWGGTGRATEFSAPGTKAFEAALSAGGSYRILRYPWTGRPAEPPAVAMLPSGGQTTAYVSWNGDTDVATWRVLGGASPEALAPLASSPREGFETSIAVTSPPPFLAVEGLAEDGSRLVRTEARRSGAWYDERAERQVAGTYQPITGDFVGGPEDDVLWYAPGSGTESLWPSTGSGFGATIATAQVTGSYRPLVLDVLGDERDEIVWWRPGVSGGFLWSWAGGAALSRPIALPAVPQAQVLDHRFARDELLLYAPGPGPDAVARWTGSATSPTVLLRSIQVSGTYQPLVGDFDANGWADVFWYLPGAGMDYAWYLTGSAGSWSTGQTSVPNPVRGAYAPVVGRLDASSDGASDILWTFRGGYHLWRSTGGSFASTSGSLPGAGAAILVPGGRDHVYWRAPATGSQIVRFVDPGADVIPAGNTEMAASAVPVVGRFTTAEQASIYWYRPGSGTEVLFASPGA